MKSSEEEKFARLLLLRLKQNNNEPEMEQRGRPSNKTVFPTHINLNLQALPGNEIKKRDANKKNLS